MSGTAKAYTVQYHRNIDGREYMYLLSSLPRCYHHHVHAFNIAGPTASSWRAIVGGEKIRVNLAAMSWVIPVNQYYRILSFSNLRIPRQT